MKEVITDANFPRTADQRVYHLGLRPGEVANRIITVGSPSRANAIAALLDKHLQPFVLSSERGFLTITGRFKGVPISVISIGMGSPNMDFFIREVRECLSGDMLVVRLGSSGALVDIPVGSVVVPKASVAVSRNVDFNFLNPEESEEPPYRISKQVLADPVLHLEVQRALELMKPVESTAEILSGTVNASADSFYSSQGRHTSFPDHNADLIEKLHASTSNLATLEMETFHLYHLAASWGGGYTGVKSGELPLTTGPVSPIISPPSLTSPSEISRPEYPRPRIRAAAAHMIFASRTSQEFITPEQVSELERWTGLGVLTALCNAEIPADQLHPEEASVWEIRPDMRN